jgi:hypothetical protein
MKSTNETEAVTSGSQEQKIRLLTGESDEGRQTHARDTPL